MALLSILTLALLAAAPAESAVTADRRPADEAAIRAHMNSIFSAYQKKDRAEVRRTHAPDWRGFLTGSRGVLRGIDAYMREAEGGLASPVRIERWTFRELDTVFYGDTAIVNYVVDLDLKFDGQAFSDTLRVIDVYRGRGRDWQQVASQVARHPDAIALRTQTPQQLAPADREKLLAVREAAWRDFFTSNQEGLGRVLSDDFIAINDGAGPWLGRREALEASEALRGSNIKLVRLEFPKTEIQVYGDTAILYTTYLYETERDGTRKSRAGRGTEVFVRREGRWVHTGWHLDSGS